MRIPIVGARVMDWDALIYGEFSVEGRDFEPLLAVDGVELFHGPMGTVAREGDVLVVFPLLIVRRLAGTAREYRRAPAEPVQLSLTNHRAFLLPDESLVIADTLRVPTYRFCAPGDCILSTSAIGPVASG